MKIRRTSDEVDQQEIGKRYGSWTVLRRVNCSRTTKFFCRCDCGVERENILGNLIDGRSTACVDCGRKKLLKGVVGTVVRGFQLIACPDGYLSNPRNTWKHIACGDVRVVLLQPATNCRVCHVRKPPTLNLERNVIVADPMTGERFTCAQLARRLGVTRECIRLRIQRYGATDYRVFQPKGMGL